MGGRSLLILLRLQVCQFFTGCIWIAPSEVVIGISLAEDVLFLQTPCLC
jgi:hypothetical protein|eukprot:COSAG06_NODE_8247_length_2224_cov_1.488941_5_plen_49_part_00